ncbi:fibronectin type III domain-containing protein [Gorillibacterium sp. sgz500922]|uniref:fibronectin type III domain-containing protein n=1 Tax=Gorillibacterium sp. sgz500922 TaxID=3446694 RepID=UPI003F665E95
MAFVPGRKAAAALALVLLLQAPLAGATDPAAERTGRAGSMTASTAAAAGAADRSGERTPRDLAMTVTGDPATSMGFAWYTAPGVTGTKLQVAEASRLAGGAWPARGAVTYAGSSAPVSVYASAADKRAEVRTAYRDHKAVASGLTPGTVYRYRVGDGSDGGWSAVGSFTTAPGPAEDKPAAAESFTFLFATDPQGATSKDYDTWKHTAEEARKTFPLARFLAVTGDLVDNGDLESQWTWFLEKPAPLLAEMPLVPVVGNHEGKAKENFSYHFALPNVSGTGAKPDGSVYAFDYGPARFFVINTEYNEALGTDAVYEKQMNWLRAEASATAKKWKIVLLHRSPYSIASHSADKDILFFRQKLTGVFDQLGIDLVLGGHDHTYARTYPMAGNRPDQTAKPNADGVLTKPKGTVYVAMGSAGTKRYPAKSGPFPYAYRSGHPGQEMFGGIAVAEDTLSVRVYTTGKKEASRLYDSFGLRK